MSAIEKLINICENRQVADTAQAELVTLRAELAQVQADYYAALKQGAEQARIAGNWQVDHIKLEAELEECRGERDDFRDKFNEAVCQISALGDVVRECKAERDTLKGEVESVKVELEATVTQMWSASKTHELALKAWRELLFATAAERDTHRLLLDELGKALSDWLPVMEDKALPTSSTIWHRKLETAKAALAKFTKYQQQCGEKGKV